MDLEQNAQIISVSQSVPGLTDHPVPEGEGGAPAPSKGLKIGPYIRPLIRKSWLILLITGIALTVGLKKSTPPAPKYQGTFRLLVEPVTPEARLANPAALTQESGGMPGQEAFTLDYPTQLVILQSPEMLNPVVAKVQTKYPNFNIGTVLTGLSVVQLGQIDPFAPKTKIIEVTFTADNATLIELFLTELKNKYLRYSLDERKTRISEGLKFIDAQLPGIQNKVDNLRGSLQNMQQKYKLLSPDQKIKDLSGQLSDIDKLLEENLRLLKEQKTFYATLQAQLDLTPDEGIAASALSEQPQYLSLQTQLQNVETEIALESSRLRFTHPKVRSLQRKKQNIMSLLELEKRKILGENKISLTDQNSQVLSFQNSIRIDLIKQMVDTANQIKMMEVRDAELQKTRNILAQEVRAFPEIFRKYNEIEQQLDLASKTLAQFLNQQKILQIQGAQTQVPWEIVSPPEVPRNGDKTPIPMKAKKGPDKKLMIALIGGLAVSLGSAFAIEKIRNIFYTLADLKDGIDLPVLGFLPSYKAKTRRTQHSILLLSEADGKNKKIVHFWEEMDALYANLKFRFNDRHIGSIACCSSENGEGKSTLAIHLAQVAASVGQRVLLVDANLHAPELHQMLNLPNDRGLSDLLANQASAAELIQGSTLSNNLFILTSGKSTSTITRLLASVQMQYIMQSFQAQFDLVIYDTPPLSETKDGYFLAGNTDGFLMVASIGRTKPTVAKQVMQQLKDFGLSGLGLIANQQHQSLVGLLF